MGWIKLDRQIMDNFLWFDEPFTKAQAWIDLLLLANHEDAQIMFNGQFKIIHRGQHLTSIRQLAKRWKWSKDKVLRFLAILRDADMIKIETSTATLISLVNYDKFQSQRDSNKDTNEYTHKDTDKDRGDTQTRSIRNKEHNNSSTKSDPLAWMDEWAKQEDSEAVKRRKAQYGQLD